MKKTLLAASAVIFLSGTALTSVLAQSYDAGTASAVEGRFQDMESEIRRLTAQVEEQSYEIRKLKEELERVTGDMQVRISDVEQGRSATGASGDAPVSSDTQPLPPSDDVSAPNFGYNDTPAQEQPAAEDPSESFSYSSHEGQTGGAPGQLGTLNVSGTVDDPGKVVGGSANPDVSAYDYAYSYIKSRNFDRAEQEFDKFMKTFPDSSLMSNAKYWYAETFYVRGNFSESARLFAEGYQKDPKGSKAAGNLLKLGMSLVGLKREKDACVAFKQLQKDYAGTAAPVLNRGKAEMDKISCQ